MPGAPAANLRSVDWLARAIERLPSDNPIAAPQQGYNNYKTQKEHWLGWLDVTSTTGTFARKSGDGGGARRVYNLIGEPKMLLWLASAAGVQANLLRAARDAADGVTNLRSKCGAIRKHIPWSEVESALSRR
jgi:hypothetical protein